MKKFLMGNEVLALSARDAGARLMFGYPITPASEILETWAKLAAKDSRLNILQTEDEMSAGFATIGACLAGEAAFTATAGPGNVLMQDAFAMAEALRLPTVAFILQRGGLSTSTVIYSQEEVILTCFGGNGEGFRVVYSTANLQELYDYGQKTFQTAWQYRWPTFLLADGYQGKMKGPVELHQPSTNNHQPSVILKKGVNLRNCYNLEEEIGELIVQYSENYNRDREKIEEYKTYQLKDAQIVLLAHGIVSAACRPAVDRLRQKGIKAGLFRPITLRPFPTQAAAKALGQAKKIVVVESALGQLASLFKSELYWINVPLVELNKPAVGFSPEEIDEAITQLA